LDFTSPSAETLSSAVGGWRCGLPGLPVGIEVPHPRVRSGAYAFGRGESARLAGRPGQLRGPLLRSGSTGICPLHPDGAQEAAVLADVPCRPRPADGGWVSCTRISSSSGPVEQDVGVVGTDDDHGGAGRGPGNRQAAIAGEVGLHQAFVVADWDDFPAGVGPSAAQSALLRPGYRARLPHDRTVALSPDIAGSADPTSLPAELPARSRACSAGHPELATRSHCRGG